MDKKTLCLYFQVHQPIRLRKYHFFDIGKNSDYYDDFANRTITRKVADRCYLPANRMMLELIRPKLIPIPWLRWWMKANLKNR